MGSSNVEISIFSTIQKEKDADPKGYLLMRGMAERQAARRDMRDAIWLGLVSLGMLVMALAFGGGFGEARRFLCSSLSEIP